MQRDRVDARVHAVRILVAESKWTGHHLFFARDIATALGATDHEVILAVSDSDAESPRRMLEIATEGIAEDRIEVCRTLTGPDAGHARIDDRHGGLEVDSISREITRTRADRVVVPSADAVAFFLGGRSSAHDLLRSKETSLILHQPYVGYGGRGIRFAVRREIIRRRLRRTSARVAALDHRIDDAMGPRRAVTLLPGNAQIPADISKRDARNRFGIEHDRPVFLAAGEHADRKGTHRLVDAWPAESEGTLLIVGRCSEPVRNAVARRPGDLDTGRIRIIDEAVDALAYSAAFRACDIVTACYPQHFGASGVLHTAAQMGRPVLGSNYGYIGDCIRSFGLGTEVDCRDPKALAEALRKAVRQPPMMDPVRSRPFHDFHKPESFRRHVQMMVVGRTSDGIDPAPPPRS